MAQAYFTPSSNLLANLRTELMQLPAFAQLSAAHVERLIRGASQAYFAPGETVLSPADGPVEHLYLVRSGSVSGRLPDDDEANAFQIDAGDLFPVGALMAGRAVHATYKANADTFCLLLPKEEVQAVAAQSVPFADFLNARMQRLLELSRRAWCAQQASQAFAEQSFESPLSSLLSGAPVASVLSDTALGVALELMHARRIGSVLVTDAAAAAGGHPHPPRHDPADHPAAGEPRRPDRAGDERAGAHAGQPCHRAQMRRC